MRILAVSDFGLCASDYYPADVTKQSSFPLLSSSTFTTISFGVPTPGRRKSVGKSAGLRGALDVRTSNLRPFPPSADAEQSACLRTRSPPLAHIISFSPYWPSGGLEITVLYQTLVEHTDEAGTEKKQGSELGRTVAQSASVPLRKQQCTPTFQEGPN